MAEISLHTYYEQIDVLLDENRLADAIAHCRHILQQVPRHVPTYRLLGKALLEQNDFTGATDIFQRVLSADPEDFVAHVGLAIINKEEGLLDEARWHMERAFEMDPYNNVIQAELKDLYATNGKGAERLMLTREALARLHVKGELYQQAVAELRRSVVEFPDRVDLKTLLAEALWRDEQRVDAVEVCLEVLDALPNCIKANAILAEVWLITGRIEEAQDYLQKIHPMLLLDREHLDDADSPAAIAFQTEGAMPLPERVTVERLDDETLLPAGLDETADWVDELGLEGDISADELASDTSDWLTALQAASATQEASAAQEASGRESTLAAAESAYLAEGDENAWFALDEDGPEAPDREAADYVADIDVEMMKTADDDDELPPVPDWLQEVAAEADAEAAAEADAEADLEPVAPEDAAPYAAMDAGAGDEAAEREDEAAVFDFSDLEEEFDEETMVAAELDAAVPDWLREIDQEEPALEEAWLQGPGDDLGTLPEGDDWSSWLAGEDVSESAAAPPGGEAPRSVEEAPEVADAQSVAGESRFEEEMEWEASPMSEQEGMAGYPEEPDDLSAPPEDLDDALAWLEGLAAKQGARREELPSLQDADEGDDVETAYPDWLAGDMDEIPAGIGAVAGPEEESQDMAPADIPDWLLESVGDEPEAAELPVAEVEPAAPADLSWLDEIAAGGGAALDEPLTLSWEKERSEPEEEGEPLVTDAGFDAGLSDATFVTGEAEVGEPPEDLDEAMAWLEQLAARQGADLEELPTVGEKPAEMAPPDMAMPGMGDEEAFPDWLAELGPADAEPEAAPAGAAVGDLTEDFPDDPEDALAWLEELAQQDALSEPETPPEMPEVTEPPTPAVPHDVLAAQAAAAALAAAEEQAAAQQEPAVEDEWIDQIPDDPDAAMAWLEQLAARQGADLDELPTVDEVPEEVELPEWISREVAAAQSSLLVEAEPEPAGVDEPVAVEEPLLEPEPAILEVEEPAAEELPAVEEPAVMEAEKPVAEPEADWRVEMEGEIAEALPDWLSMDLAEVAPELPEDETEDWDYSRSDVAGWLVAEEEVRATEPPPVAEPEPEPEQPPVAQPDLAPAGVVSPHLQKAREAMSQGNIDQAIETYQLMLSQGANLDSLIQELENTRVDTPRQPQVHRLLGDAYMQNGDLQKALEVYQDALGML